MGDPTLRVTGLDTGVINLGDDGSSASNLSGLALSAGHAAQTGGDEDAALQILIVGDTQLQTTSVQQGVEGTMDNALGPDVHHAAGGHLTVVSDTDGSSAVEGLLVVEAADVIVGLASVKTYEPVSILVNLELWSLTGFLECIDGTLDRSE